MKNPIILFIVLICGGAISSSAQTFHWKVLRDAHIDANSTWHYDWVSYLDDHNFAAIGEHASAVGNQVIALRSTDGGNSWNISDLGLPLNRDSRWKSFHKILMLDSLHIIAIGDSGLIAQTSDAGQTWIREDYPTRRALSDVHFSDPQTGIITGIYIILTTTDGGVSWQTIPNPPAAWMRNCHSYGNGMFRAYSLDREAIYTTHDFWHSWDSTFIVGPGDSAGQFNGVGNCEFIGHDSILAEGTKGYDSSQVLFSSNGGQSWNAQIYRKTHTWPWNISTRLKDFWVGAGRGPGMLFSTNQGITWTDDTITPPISLFATYNVQVISPTRVVAVMADLSVQYIMELDIEHLSVQPRIHDITTFNLFPNPASSMVNIKSPRGKASVIVTDMLGRRILTSQLTDDGKLLLDVSALSDGVYLVTLVMDYGTMAGKLVIAR